jgi:outer membrane protein assembly factor BamE (lipoprotein component of BamABCDE complex)
MRLLIAISAVCTVLVLALLVRRLMYGEVFSEAQLSRLKRGLTTNEIIAIVGLPSRVSAGQWEYTRGLMFNVGLVIFDDNGRLMTAINE